MKKGVLDKGMRGTGELGGGGGATSSSGAPSSACSPSLPCFTLPSSPRCCSSPWPVPSSSSPSPSPSSASAPFARAGVWGEREIKIGLWLAVRASSAIIKASEHEWRGPVPSLRGSWHRLSVCLPFRVGGQRAWARPPRRPLERRRLPRVPDAHSARPPETPEIRPLWGHCESNGVSIERSPSSPSRRTPSRLFQLEAAQSQRSYRVMTRSRTHCSAACFIVVSDFLRRPTLLHCPTRLSFPPVSLDRPHPPGEALPRRPSSRRPRLRPRRPRAVPSRPRDAR